MTDALYKIARDGTVIGIYTLRELADRTASGAVKRTDHYWTEGMTEWKMVSELVPVARLQSSKTIKWIVIGALVAACLVAVCSQILPHVYEWQKREEARERAIAAYNAEKAEADRQRARRDAEQAKLDAERADRDAKDKREEAACIEWAKRAILAQLKAPSTASFVNVWVSLPEPVPGNSNATVSRTVYGSVDAQNVYGAMLRSKWRVMVISNRNDETVSVQGVEFDDK